jgi:hypothetical protein
MKAELEFTGTYYRCFKCKHIWDYNDFNCPECGSDDFEDINENEIQEHIKKLQSMLSLHGSKSLPTDEEIEQELGQRINDEYCRIGGDKDPSISSSITWQQFVEGYSKVFMEAVVYMQSKTALTYKPTEWISVEDRLPDDLETVWLANMKKDWIWIGCLAVFDSEGNWTWAETNMSVYIEDNKIVAECESEDLDVTHWMPLPEFKEK